MSQPVPIFAGRIENGKIQLADPDGWRVQLQRNEGREIELRLSRRKKERSMSQNKYYWGCVVALLAEHCGYEPEEMHAALKMKFLRQYEDQALPSIRSTTDLDTAEFANYIEQVRRLAAEMGVVIPDPSDVA